MGGGGRGRALARTHCPPTPRSTTWPASCRCRRASCPGRCGPRRAGGPQSGPGVCLGSAPGRLLSGPGMPCEAGPPALTGCPCRRLLPRSAPSARMTSYTAWSARGPSSPVSSRVTGWASTGGRPIGGVQGSCGQWARTPTRQPTGAHSHHPPAPTGGFSSPPILTGGTGSVTGR